MATYASRNTARMAGPMIIFNQVAESTEEPAAKLWQECKAFFNQHGQWPTEKTDRRLKTFIYSLRDFCNGKSTMREFPRHVVKEARQMGALEMHKRGGKAHKEGPVTRAKAALERGEHPEPDDLTKLRHALSQGRIGKSTEEHLHQLAKPLNIEL